MTIIAGCCVGNVRPGRRPAPAKAAHSHRASRPAVGQQHHVEVEPSVPDPASRGRYGASSTSTRASEPWRGGYEENPPAIVIVEIVHDVTPQEIGVAPSGKRLEDIAGAHGHARRGPPSPRRASAMLPADSNRVARLPGNAAEWRR